MAIDASIPLQGKTINLADIMADAQTMRMREAQMRNYDAQAQAQADKQRREQERNGALSDLIATRGPNGYDTTGDAFKRYTTADPEGAFKMLDGLDAEKRKQVEAGIKDMAAAVQWADTPQKWAVVQQHYGQFDPKLAATPFEAREHSLIQLGQMGEYLKATEPKIVTPQPGGGAFAYTRSGGMEPLILPNDGSQPMGAPGGAPAGNPGGIPQAAANHLRQNPHLRGAFDAKYGAGASARILGGAGGNASGGFRPVGMTGERITSTFRTVAHNKAVGGVENSFHTRRGLDGKPLARDSVPPRGMSMAAYAAELRRLNPHLDVINEGDHVHMEPR